jgi:predicted amidohydrolase YtcJ
MRQVFAAGVSMVLGCAGAQGGGPTRERAAEADLVLRGGEIVTMDPAQPRARAVAVRGDRIVAVGPDAERLVGPRTRTIDLGGRTVLPGLTDAHAHLSGLGKALEETELRGCDSPEACAARVKGASGDWVLGRGWDQNLFSSRAFPDHAALDRVEPTRPVWLRRVDGHAAWANARALAAAGITRATADPPGGRIVRGEDGEPTGVFVDDAMSLVERIIPAPSREARTRAIERAQKEALAHGLTCVHEMGIDDETIKVYRELAASGRLAVRVYAFASAELADKVLATPPDPKTSEARFKLRGIKLYADGALGSRGAALLEPYADDPKNRGLVLTPKEEIERVSRRALETGWQIAVHAIGDRANRDVLDAFERAGCSAKKDARFRIEHAQVVALADVPRFHALGVIASMQPQHATSDGPWAPARLGPERLAGAYAWRRFLEAGVPVAGGSDFPVEEVEPVSGALFAAVTRRTRSGAQFTPDQRMTFDEAVRAFTESAAYAAFEEGWRGRVAKGFAADLTVLDRDVAHDPAASLAGARAQMTIVGGRVAFER